MNDYLKRHKITLTATGPIFIGSGKTLKKKDYILDRKNNQVLVPDIDKMWQLIRKKRLNREFLSFLQGEDKSLYAWLLSNGFSYNDFKNFTSYKLDSGDMEDRVVEILQFVKDAYGNPYIPGSSFKGALRTVLLSKIISENNALRSEVISSINNTNFSGKKWMLQTETKETEAKAFNTLERKNEKYSDYKNAVNDIMSGLRISDSEPLKLTDLTLCAKHDYNKMGDKKTINICRETLKPSTVITFEMTIDATIFPYDERFILDAVKLFAASYDKHFNSKFKTKDALKENSLFLGGGAGFVSKTIIYPIQGENGVRTVSRILASQFRNHFHNKDIQNNLSPSRIKRTSYRRAMYSFGLCEVKIDSL